MTNGMIVKECSLCGNKYDLKRNGMIYERLTLTKRLNGISVFQKSFDICPMCYNKLYRNANKKNENEIDEGYQD